MLKIIVIIIKGFKIAADLVTKIFSHAYSVPKESQATQNTAENILR